MNLNVVATMEFNDAPAIRDFFLVHRFVHQGEAEAITAKYNVPFSTVALGSGAAEEAWVERMAAGQDAGPIPNSLRDWLNLHADMHTQAYALIGSTPTTAPDLAVVDFARAEQFYDWMFVHQEMHDFEQASLGVS